MSKVTHRFHELYGAEGNPPAKKADTRAIVSAILVLAEQVERIADALDTPTVLDEDEETLWPST